LRILEVEGAEHKTLRDVFPDMGSTDQMLANVRAAVGTVASFLSGLAITFIYLVFLVADKVSLKQRLARALGETHSRQLLDMAEGINRSITRYLAVKTFGGALAAALSFVVLAAYGVDFALFWAFLLVLLNYIPYLGSLVAVSLPIAQSFL